MEFVSLEFFTDPVLPASFLHPEHRGYTGYEETYLVLRNKVNSSQNILLLFRGVEAQREQRNFKNIPHVGRQEGEKKYIRL